MDLIKATKRKLIFNENELIDLKECLSLGGLTKDAQRHLKNEIARVNKNVEYYSALLNILEKH